MEREAVDPRADASPPLDGTLDVDWARDRLPSHALPFGEAECDDRREQGSVALLAELRHWWWAGLISDGEYRAKEEEILRLGRT